MKKTLAVLAALTAMGGVAQVFGAAALTLNNYDANIPLKYGAAGDLVPVNATVTLVAGSASVPVTMSEPGFFDSSFGFIPGVADKATVDMSVQAIIGGVTYKGATWSQGTGAWDPNAVPAVPNPGFTLAITAAGATLSSGGTTPVVPEPSTIALGVLGAAALLIRRRK